MFSQSSDTFGFDRRQYWLHSLGTACCARVLAQPWQDIDPEDAFLAGVLHDLGKILLDEFLPNDYQQCVKDAHMSGTPLHLAERKLLGVDHSEVGGNIAARWGVPANLCSVIFDHHKYKRLKTESKSKLSSIRDLRQLGRITSLADQLAKAFEFGHAGDLFVKEEALALWPLVNDSQINFSNLYRKVRDEVDSFLELLEIPSEDMGLKHLSPRAGHAIISIDPDGPQYQALIEAHLAAHGITAQRSPNLLGALQNHSACPLWVTSVCGAPKELKEALKTLAPLSIPGVILTNTKGISGDGALLDDHIIALPYPLDFQALSSAISFLFGSQESFEIP